MLFRDREDSQQKLITDYRAILSRLQKSIVVYTAQFPEIAAVKREVDSVYFNFFLTDAHLNQLQKICKVLDRRKEEAPVIRILHEGFCEDLELFKRGATISQESIIYS